MLEGRREEGRALSVLDRNTELKVGLSGPRATLEPSATIWGEFSGPAGLQACDMSALALPCSWQDGALTPWVAFVFLRWIELT